MRYLILVAVLSLSACRTSPEVVAATATIATVETIGKGLEVFDAWWKAEQPKIEAEVVGACRHHADPNVYKACTDPLLERRLAPVYAVIAAVKVYQAALALGAAAGPGEIAEAAGKLTTALIHVGIRIGGTP